MKTSIPFKKEEHPLCQHSCLNSFACYVTLIKTYFEWTVRNDIKYTIHTQSFIRLGEMPRALLAWPHYRDEFTTSFGDPHFAGGP